jgi:hypothetical protein
MSTTDPPRPPVGLKAPGKRLWNAVLSRYVLTAGELAVLEQAARASDLCDRLEKAVRDLPELIAAGHQGQPRPHPLLAALRAEQLLLERLIGGLSLPDDDQQVGVRPSSRHASKAAQTRWRRKEVDHGDTPRSAFHPDAG